MMANQLRGFVFLLAIGSVPGAALDLSGRVVSIADGDTLTVLIDKRQVKIRIVDIDAP